MSRAIPKCNTNIRIGSHRLSRRMQRSLEIRRYDLSSWELRPPEALPVLAR